MSENKDKIQELREDDIIEDKGFEDPEYSLSDDRRVKVLSPGAMVAKRFFRNRTAMVGLVILLFMFAFSFLGGVVSPYDEDQRFYRVDKMQKEYCAAIKNDEFRYSVAEGQEFSSIIQAKMVLAVQTSQSEFSYGGVDYKLDVLGEDFYAVSIKDGPELGIAYKSVFFPSDESTKLPYNVEKEGLLAYTNGEHRFVADGKSYTIDDNGIVESGGVEVGYISKYIVQSIMSDVFLSRDFKERLIVAINDGIEDFVFVDESGEEYEYKIQYDAYTKKYTIRQEKDTFVYDSYGAPSKEHWLGTDRNGMDMLTRLMYGGRVSLIIGFIVELIANFIGVILGGISGYFGGWVDNLIMRIVDIFYCIPSMPIIIILGAAMDAQMVDPKLRMVYLMLILGFLGWPGVARMIRGQILSLREQEFMTATEATGISVSRRIFRHLVPNVIPLLIVSASMGIGGTIITEATLSFLGLGVKFPFASWGNIINDVNNTFVLQNYWFIWIPAGVLLLTTVLAFNLVGDGLRDAFDPRMKR